MQTISYDLGLFTKQNPLLQEKLNDFNIWSISQNYSESIKNKFPIFVCDQLIYDHPEMAIKVSQAVQKGLIKKILLLTTSIEEKIPVEIFNLVSPALVVSFTAFNKATILKLYEQIQNEDQDLAYLHLSKELNQEYESIKNDLEQQLDEKTQNLLESRRKIYEINSRTEFLRRILFTISEINNPSLIEPKLNDLLTHSNKVTWVKVVASSDCALFEKDIHENFDSTLFRTDLILNKNSYHIYFFKGDKKAFKKSDIDLFMKLSEMLQTSLDRFSHLDELQKSEALYQLAFSSSKNPILILNRQYQVVQTNLNNSGQLSCYQLLFQRNAPCDGCQFGKRFEIENQGKVFQVDSSPIQNEDLESDEQFVHVYEDITERIQLETKIIQKSRLAELGIIASSIAHELNNPLGGIISYLQLMKLDLPKEHPFQQDLLMMFEATQRMKKIIDSLLVFSRKGELVSPENTNIFEVVKSISDSFNLQWAQQNIKVVIHPNDSLKKVNLSLPVLKEAIQLIFQLFNEKHKERKKMNQIGLVEVKFFQDQINTSLFFSTNLFITDHENSTKELNLLILEKILSDQYYQLVIDHPQKDWTRLKINIVS